MLIHGALNDYAHGVHEVTSGTRYAYSNFVLPVTKHPGTFPLYGTKENEERWNAGVDEWLTPIDFKWEAPDTLKQQMEEVGKESLPPATLTPSEFLKNS